MDMVLIVTVVVRKAIIVIIIILSWDMDALEWEEDDGVEKWSIFGASSSTKCSAQDDDKTRETLSLFQRTSNWLKSILEKTVTQRRLLQKQHLKK